jgi:hypothetical protein
MYVFNMQIRKNSIKKTRLIKLKSTYKCGVFGFFIETYKLLGDFTNFYILHITHNGVDRTRVHR